MVKNQRNRNLLLACMTAVGVSTASQGVSAEAELPELQTYATYSELSARWWQWALSIPAASNPIADEDGENCSEGQYDDVWFLAGTFGSTVIRNCAVPAGKPIFFPLINSVAFKPTGKEFKTLNEMRAAAAGTPDLATDLSCTVDGEACAFYRVRSPSFTVLAPPKGLVAPGQLRTPGNADVLVADGYWALLPPLEAGEHQIKFAGTAGDFAVDVTYNIQVN